jgi:DNA-binding response OmpR family regulator
MKHRIAVYDYPLNLLKLFQSILTKKGYEVLIHQGELRCLDELQNFQPNLIILGYVVGYHQDEVDIIRQLRQHPAIHNTPLLICSTGAIYLKNLVSTTDHDLLVIGKPFSMGELMLAVEHLLSLSKDERFALAAGD